MKRFLYVVIVLILLLFAVSSQAGSQPVVSGTLVFLGSSDAPGSVTAERLQRCLRHLAEALKVEDKVMPSIVVFQVSQRVAKAMGLKPVTVRRNTGQGGGPYFELWLVGQVTPADYVPALESILEYNFGLQNAEPERVKLIARVLRYELSTVDAKAYGE